MFGGRFERELLNRLDMKLTKEKKDLRKKEKGIQMTKTIKWFRGKRWNGVVGEGRRRKSKKEKKKVNKDEKRKTNLQKRKNNYQE